MNPDTLFYRTRLVSRKVRAPPPPRMSQAQAFVMVGAVGRCRPAPGPTWPTGLGAAGPRPSWWTLPLGLEAGEGQRQAPPGRSWRADPHLAVSLGGHVHCQAASSPPQPCVRHLGRAVLSPSAFTGSLLSQTRPLTRPVGVWTRPTRMPRAPEDSRRVRHGPGEQTVPAACWHPDPPSTGGLPQDQEEGQQHRPLSAQGRKRAPRCAATLSRRHPEAGDAAFGPLPAALRAASVPCPVSSVPAPPPRTSPAPPRHRRQVSKHPSKMPVPPVSSGGRNYIMI